MLGKDAEELRFGPTQAHGVGAQSLDEIGAGFVDVGLGCRGHIAARRAGRAEHVEGFPPIGDDGWERIGRNFGEHGAAGYGSGSRHRKPGLPHACRAAA